MMPLPEGGFMEAIGLKRPDCEVAL
jgi:hypothetical protein